jgi:hypothetical protein
MQTNIRIRLMVELEVNIIDKESRLLFTNDEVNQVSIECVEDLLGDEFFDPDRFFNFKIKKVKVAK